MPPSSSVNPPTAPADHSSSVWPDLGIVAIAVGGYFVLAVMLELSEAVAGFTRKYEHWQLDELPLTLLWLSVGLSWFAFRRVREVRFALAQRIEAQVQVAALLAHNRELAQRLIVVQEHERQVLARDLHDEIGQNCTAIRAEARFILHAGVHAQAMGDADTCAMRCEPIMGSAQRIAQVAQRLHAMVHNMLLRLRPPALDSLGLEAALQMLCESWETQTGISCGFFPENVPTLLADATAVAVFRVVQESLTNVARHAGATQVTVKLRPSADGACLHLRIQDDGCGLAPQAAANTSPAALGHMGMYERVAALHGRIDFMSGPGQGLCIAVAVPLLMEVLPP